MTLYSGGLGTEVLVEPRTGPIALEIGSTKAFTTLEHCVMGYGVARWPYASHVLWVMHTADPTAWMHVPDWRMPPPAPRLAEPSRTEELRRSVAEAWGEGSGW